MLGDLAYIKDGPIRRCPINLAIITSSYPLNEYDDVAPFAGDFVAALRLLGHRVTVLVPDRAGEKGGDPDVFWFKWRGTGRPLVRTRLYSPADILSVVSLFRDGRRQIRERLAAEKIDYILAFWAVPSGLFALDAREKLGIPFSVWALGSDIHTWAKYPFIRSRIKKVLKGAGLLFADGYGLAGQVEEVSGRSCEFLPTSRTLPDVKAIDMDSGIVNFLYVGRLEKVKGIDILIDAMTRLRDKKMRLYIVGQGSLRDVMEQRARPLADKVVFLGTLDVATLTSYMKGCDALVIPSRRESIPVVLTEALQLGKPLIVAYVGDMGELVKKYNAGLVVPSEDPVALADAMVEFMTRRDEFAGIEAPSEFTPQAAAEKFLGLLARTFILL